MEPYLQAFQSDAPLLTFVTSDLQGLLETLMSKFLKQGELEKAGTTFKLVKLDVTQPSVQVAPRDADVGFAAKASFEKLLKEKKISDLDAFDFKKDCITMLASTVAEIQERSLLKYSLARKLVCLDLQKMVLHQKRLWRCFKLCYKSWLIQGGKHQARVIPFCLSSGGICLMQGSTTRSSSHCTSTTTQDWTPSYVTHWARMKNSKSCGPHWRFCWSFSQSGCCWKRVFCQQRSAGSKHAGDELESNQTCAQLCCISEDQDMRLQCDWQTFEIL